MCETISFRSPEAGQPLRIGSSEQTTKLTVKAVKRPKCTFAQLVLQQTGLELFSVLALRANVNRPSDWLS